MLKSTGITVCFYEAPFTQTRRDLFAHTHQEMSGSDPTGAQYPHDEQYEMYLACYNPDERQMATNLLELIEYLVDNGVKVPDIIVDIRGCKAQSYVEYGVRDAASDTDGQPCDAKFAATPNGFALYHRRRQGLEWKADQQQRALRDPFATPQRMFINA